jgi:hypothetical protein
MKRIIAIALLAISAVSATPIFAQVGALKANVPFGFSVGEKLLPADTYLISTSITGVVLIRGTKGGSSALTNSMPGERQSGSGYKLEFQRYGDQYFLHRIVRPSVAGMTLDLPTSKKEKRVRSERPSPNLGEVAFLEIK